MDTPYLNVNTPSVHFSSCTIFFALCNEVLYANSDSSLILSKSGVIVHPAFRTGDAGHLDPSLMSHTLPIRRLQIVLDFLVLSAFILSIG